MNKEWSEAIQLQAKKLQDYLAKGGVNGIPATALSALGSGDTAVGAVPDSDSVCHLESEVK